MILSFWIKRTLLNIEQKGGNWKCKMGSVQ